jgi:hypothetical protein
MSINSLLNPNSGFSTLIVNFLPGKDQAKLSHVSKATKSLVDSANSSSYVRDFKTTEFYKGCEIENLNGPWKDEKEKIQAAVTIIDRQLTDFRTLLTDEEWKKKGIDSPFQAKRLSMIEKVKVAEAIEDKKAELLLHFFTKLCSRTPEAAEFDQSISAAVPLRKKAQKIRGWMQENQELLCRISSLSKIGINTQDDRAHFQPPPEIFLLKGLEPKNFKEACTSTFAYLPPSIAKEVLEDPKFTALSIEDFMAVVSRAAHKNSFGNLALLMNHSKYQEAPDSLLGQPLRAAAESGDCEVVELLLSHHLSSKIGADDLGCALFLAADRGHEKVVALLLSQKLSLITAFILGMALSLAAQKGQEKVVTLLLNHQLSSEIPAYDLGEVLYGAVERGHEKVVELLLDHQLSSKISDEQLSLALERSNKPDVREEIQKTIKKRKATLDAK